MNARCVLSRTSKRFVGTSYHWNGFVGRAANGGQYGQSVVSGVI